MIRRCFMVVCAKGAAVFLERGKAEDYAARMHGYIVPMEGRDTHVETIEEVKRVDHAANTPQVDKLPGNAICGTPLVHGES